MGHGISKEMSASNKRSCQQISIDAYKPNRSLSLFGQQNHCSECVVGDTELSKKATFTTGNWLEPIAVREIRRDTGSASCSLCAALPAPDGVKHTSFSDLESNTRVTPCGGPGEFN